MNTQAEVQAVTDIANSAPSLSTSAMGAEMSTGVWSGRRKDSFASEKVNYDAGADKNVASVYKALLGECDELDAVKKHIGNVRNHVHYHYTLPWSDGGMRLLTTAAYFDYHEKMTEAQATFDVLVNTFLNAYDWEVTQAQVRLGTLFNPNEYPSKDSIAEKFYFNIHYIPLPEAGDFRLDIGNAQAQHLKDSYNNYYQNRFDTAMADIWQRLLEPLKNLSEKMDYADHEDKKRFKNTIVDNVLAIVDVMRMANVHGDPQMNAVQNKLEGALRHVTPEALREDCYLRQTTKKAADDIIRQINALPSLM